MEVHNANSLSDYVRIISKIALKEGGSGILWFRGVSNWYYALIPSLYRENDLFDYGTNTGKKYTAVHYAEDVRTQHYIAKNYHFYDKLPTSRVEWLEVMQHHCVRTRVLDWSESSIHSLLFAVEPFIDTSKYSMEDRKHQNPCVWVLQPQKLNRNIIQYLLDDRNRDFIKEKVCGELKMTDREWREVELQMNYFEDLYEAADRWKSMRHLNGIVNLSEINDEMLRDRSRLKEMLCSGEMLPIFYFLSRIYSDGMLLEKRGLPPLAVVEAYHSERIKAQKGVFTVYPVYQEKETDDILRRSGLDPNGMQNMVRAEDCMVCINLLRPGQIARELLRNGVRDSWLYPENPIIANEIENCGII